MGRHQVHLFMFVTFLKICATLICPDTKAGLLINIKCCLTCGVQVDGHLAYMPCYTTNFLCLKIKKFQAWY